MAIQAATPYLILNGKVGRALELYKEALGAKTETLQRFGDVDHSCPEASRDRVMHAELRVGEAVLMMSDGGSDEPDNGAAGSVKVGVAFDDPDQMKRSFAVLAETGTVVEPIFSAPWGALFGVVRDELGVDWMFNCAL